MHYILYLFNY